MRKILKAVLIGMSMRKKGFKKIVLLFMCTLVVSPLYAGIGTDKDERLRKYETKAIQWMENSEQKEVKNIEKFKKDSKCNIVLNGEDITSTVSEDLMPINASGINYVPLRMLESVIKGIELDYDSKTKIVKARAENSWIMLQIGKNLSCYCVFDEKSVKLYDYTFTTDGPAMANGKVYLPLRYAIEKLGYKVIWDGKTSTLSISTTDKEPTIPEGLIKPVENKESNKSYYLGGVAIKIPANFIMVDLGNGDVTRDRNKIVGLTVQCSTNKEFKPTSVRENGYGYAGSLEVYKTFGDPNANLENLDTQLKDLENILNQLGSKEEVSKIMQKVKADFKISTDTEQENMKLGDFLVEVGGYRNMAIRESLIMYKKVNTTITSGNKDGAIYYLGGKPFKLPEGLAVTTSPANENGVSYATSGDDCKTLHFRGTATPNLVKTAFRRAFAGGLTICSGKGFVDVNTQYKLAEQILNQILEEKEVDQVMAHAKKFMTSNSELSTDFIYGDLEVTVSNSHNDNDKVMITFNKIVD